MPTTSEAGTATQADGLHILSLITSFTSGGAEMIVANLSDAFVSAGYRSSVAALVDARSIGNCPDMERKLRDRVFAGGGSAHSLALASRHNPFAGALALRRLVAEIGPDVIHAHTARAIPMLALARVRTPIVLTHHNSRFSFPVSLFRFFDRVVDRYVAISAECAQLMNFHVQRPVTVITNAAGTGFSAAHPRVAPEKRVIIQCVGALSRQKDYPTLIRAAGHLRALLARRGQSVVIRIAGGGALTSQLETLAKSHGVADIVQFLGTRSDIPALLCEADLFVNCSLYEGFPVAIIEAMTTGLPIVATDVAGNRGLVREGHNGLLVRGRDPAALALRIDEMLAHPSRYEAMSRAAIEESRNHSIESSSHAHLRQYRLASLAGSA